MPAEREAGRDGLCHTNNGSDGGDDTGDSSDTGGDTSDDATGGGTDTGMAPPDGTVDGAGDEGAKRPTDSIWWWTRMAGYGGVHSDPEDDREGQSAKQKYQDKIIAFLKKQVFNPDKGGENWGGAPSTEGVRGLIDKLRRELGAEYYRDDDWIEKLPYALVAFSGSLLEAAGHHGMIEQGSRHTKLLVRLRSLQDAAARAAGQKR